MTHEPKTQDCQIQSQSKVAPVKAIWDWFTEAHYEVRSAQSYIESKHHRL
jgi:hypothetical protein